MTEPNRELKTIETYDKTASHWIASHMQVNDWEGEAARLKELLPSGSVLEAGCGGGRDAAELIRLGFDYYGTDASKGMIAAAQSEVPSGSFEVRNVYDLAELNQRFDGFWACAILLHMPKKRIDEALQAILATQKPGAIGMISIKDGDHEDFEVRDKDGAHEERLFVYWRKEDFDKVLGRNGLSILEYTYRPVSSRTNWHIYFVQKDG